MNVKRNVSDSAMLGGLAIATLGMALVAFGVAVRGVFFPGVYLLALGLLATAIGALLRLIARDQA